MKATREPRVVSRSLAGRLRRRATARPLATTIRRQERYRSRAFSLLFSPFVKAPLAQSNDSPRALLITRLYSRRHVVFVGFVAPQWPLYHDGARRLAGDNRAQGLFPPRSRVVADRRPGARDPSRVAGLLALCQQTPHEIEPLGLLYRFTSTG